MIKGEYRGASLGWLVVILVALGIWALVWGPDGDDGPDVGLEVDGPLIRSTLPNDEPGVMRKLAEITGIVTLAEGCIVLVDPGAVRPTTAVIWPSSTSWDEAAQTIKLPNGDVVALGDEVWGGGGYHPLSDADHPAAARLRDCAAATGSAQAARINATTDAIRAGGPP